MKKKTENVDGEEVAGSAVLLPLLERLVEGAVSSELQTLPTPQLNRPLTQPSPTRGEGFSLDTATPDDFAAVKEIFLHVVDEGETYSYERAELADQWIRDYWLKNVVTTLVAKVDGKVAGVCAIRVNRTGRGNHIANASYIVHHEHRGIGIGHALGRASLQAAKDKGFKAMQFNYVVSTNVKAVSLWQSLGFKIIGTMPQGYRHSRHGLVDVYMMHCFLEDRA
ncbi:MAG: GNAT family N-acetyltransferase [Rickettsiales bacterium]